MEITIRELKEVEYPILSDFLYEAIFIPEGISPPDRNIIESPELQIYIRDFGKEIADAALGAEMGGCIVGVVWSRIMKDYGHVDDDTPSLAISLYKEYRGRGIGTQLMTKMLQLLKERGYKKVSLSVQKTNYAVKLYEKTGFRIVDENPEEYIMVCKL